MVLRDASGPDPAGVTLPPAEFLPHGPAGEVALGASRDDVMKAAGSKAQMVDGALVLSPKTAGSYDVLLVWFDGDRVTRIVARHAEAAPAKASPNQLTKLLSEAWGRDARSFGWPAYQETSEGQELRGLGWHDERTRVRLFWQESQNGPSRLYTEWKELPAK